jgi:hypothetical protein
MAALFLGGALLPGVAGAGTLDQQQTTYEGVYYIAHDQSLAQVFTAGITGKLDQVDLLLDKVGSPTIPVEVEIRDVGSAGPGLMVLSNASIPATSVPGPETFVSVTFASPTAVTAGSQYAIVAYGGDPAGSYGWGEQAFDPYPRGVAFSTADSPPRASSLWGLQGDGQSDLGFKTYVIPSPAPTKKKCKHHKKKHKSDAVIAKKCKKKHHR